MSQLRPQRNLRVVGPLAAFGALLIMSASTLAFAATGPSEERAATSIPISIRDRALSYGESLVLSGRAAGAREQPIRLEFRTRGTQRWRVVAVGRADDAGRFRFQASLARSGAVRVVAPATTAPRLTGTASASPATSSRERGVVVAAQHALHGSSLEVLRGDSAWVRGTLRPGRAGRLVVLERRARHGWRELARDRTDGNGRYLVRAPSGALGDDLVRVRFRGDAANASAQRTVGHLRVFRTGLASRYDMYGGALACGGRLGYGSMVVAHKTLPCGTKVTIRYGGRTAHAVVRDRGPYVGGREWDLAGGVARKLGFDGVGTIWVSID